MRVLITGLGNIGTTLASLLLRYRDVLGIGEVVALQRTITEWGAATHAPLLERGLIIVPYTQEFEAQARRADYVFETTANGIGMKHRAFYEDLGGLKGASAQGSEAGFGMPYMSGINDAAVAGQRFVQVVSCNSHGTAALLHGLSAGDLASIVRADLVVVRRSEDLGQHQRLVSANVVSRHLDAQTGTHHGIDVTRLLGTIGVQIPLTTSDITTPSQLLHSVRFMIEFSRPITEELIQDRIATCRLLSSTHRFDSNVIFEVGRRYGHAGRIYSPAIVVANNLLINRTIVQGWAFVPQEGNTLLSTIHAFILQTGGDTSVMEAIVADLTRDVW